MRNIKINHRTKRRARVLFVTGMLVALSMTLFAQENNKRKKANSEEMKKQRTERFEKMVNEIPNLTPDQKTQLYAIQSKYENRANNERPKREKMSPEDREKLTVDQRKAMIDEQSSHRAEMKKMRLEQREEIKSVLTEEQITFLKEKRKEMKGKGEGKRQRNNRDKAE